MDATYYSRVGPRPLDADDEPVVKKRKIVPEPKPEIPKLATPQEIKAAVQASNAMSTSNAQSSNQDAVKPDISAAQNIMQRTKRPAEDLDRVSAMASNGTKQHPPSAQNKSLNQSSILQASAASGSSSAPPLPGAAPNQSRPPPFRKRPKQPASIFMPNKRMKPQ